MEAELILRLEYDQFAESPNDWKGWKVITFNQRRTTDEPCFLYRTKEPDLVGEVPVPVDAEIRKLLKDGKAFWLETNSGGELQLWRSGVFARNVSGVIVWDGGRLPTKERKESAKEFLRTFNQWANGEVYSWQVEHSYGDYLDGCGDCYNLDQMFAEINLLLVRPWRLESDCEFLLEGRLKADVLRLRERAVTIHS